MSFSLMPTQVRCDGCLAVGLTAWMLAAHPAFVVLHWFGLAIGEAPCVCLARRGSAQKRDSCKLPNAWCQRQLHRGCFVKPFLRLVMLCVRPLSSPLMT